MWYNYNLQKNIGPKSNLVELYDLPRIVSWIISRQYLAKISTLYSKINYILITAAIVRYYYLPLAAYLRANNRYKHVTFA